MFDPEHEFVVFIQNALLDFMLGVYCKYIVIKKMKKNVIIVVNKFQSLCKPDANGITDKSPSGYFGNLDICTLTSSISIDESLQYKIHSTTLVHQRKEEMT
jgi:hypothetical protein